MVKPPAPVRPGAGLAGGLQPGDLLRARAQKVVLLKKRAQCQDLLDIWFQCTVPGHLVADLARRLAPAQQAFEFQPADAVEAVDHGIVDHPRRLALVVVGGFAQAQVFAQGRQWQVGKVEHHQPLQARNVATGRRSR
ncbi:hypothetical protein PPS11_27106 [Pseudomonas putida S11]|nr:hypothetical protein PPS11_27106 [Pseudomonas putida S11]